LSTFPDGVYQYGGVPVGVGRLADIFQAGNIWFVDGTNGSAAYTGKKPDNAFALPTTAVSAASREGVIYIKPMSNVACDDVYYSDNITVDVTRPMLQFIGAGAGTVPGYRGSAQIRPSTAASHIFTIQAAGVVIQNLHLNQTGATAASCPIYSQRLGYTGAVSLQVRNCRFIANVTDCEAAIALKSCQYSIVEDNIFLDCVVGVKMEATSGSPQGYTIRRNIFEGLVLTRDADILITMTDINSRGHVIADNIFADGLPNSASARFRRFIFDTAAATSVATGIVTRNSFATATADSMGTTGAACKLAAGWFAAGNLYEGTSASGLSGFVTRA